MRDISGLEKSLIQAILGLTIFTGSYSLLERFINKSCH